MRRVAGHFGGIAPGEVTRPVHTAEPEQLGERRVVVNREGTTAYLKLGYHAPAFADADFFPMLVLDAVLTGAKGLNLWASFRTPPPQRSARLYRALVNTGLASLVSGGLVPTQHPFLYTISITVTEGEPLSKVEEAALAEIERVRSGGVTPAEVEKARTQLRARLVFENDSVTNIAHQIGYFETIAGWRAFPELRRGIDAVTLAEVNEAAVRRLAASNRTVGWFEPR
jgi:zinc protease